MRHQLFGTIYDVDIACLGAACICQTIQVVIFAFAPLIFCGKTMNDPFKNHQGGLNQPMNFRRMKFFKAVAVGFSGLSSLDGGIFPEPFLAKLNLGGQTPFTEMLMCFFLSCQYHSIHSESEGT